MSSPKSKPKISQTELDSYRFKNIAATSAMHRNGQLSHERFIIEKIAPLFGEVDVVAWETIRRSLEKGDLSAEIPISKAGIGIFSDRTGFWLKGSAKRLYKILTSSKLALLKIEVKIEKQTEGPHGTLEIPQYYFKLTWA